MKPLCIDLFCGLGGWTEGFLAEGYRVIGFDIVRHPYPAQLVLEDVLRLHGAQFRDAAYIVASPPCQAYSYRAMPWSRARALPAPDNSLFEASFRIQCEANEASGRHIPLIVENVCGAQKWVGRAAWHYGSYYLWGDVPALMPYTFVEQKFPFHCGPRQWKDRMTPRLDDSESLVRRQAFHQKGAIGGASWFYNSRNDPRDVRRAGSLSIPLTASEDGSAEKEEPG